MATREFPLEPQAVTPVETKYRRIQTRIPVPESIETLKKLRDLEATSMSGQPPIIWHHGDNFTVSDAFGNRWIDFSAGVLVTASGHARREIIDAITQTAQQGLYHAYCFPTDVRLKLVEKLKSMMPAPLERVFLVTTGSEATEVCIKLMKTNGRKVGGPEKNVIVTFDNAFHGRTMGAQLAGGAPALKAWIGEDPTFVQVPYPDGFRQEDVSFTVFEKTLTATGISPDRVCGVMSETYQGCNAALMPTKYAQDLRAWCDRHGAVLTFDEVQAGFGRTGTVFGFMHYGIVPDLVACGKGMSGGMPSSAVLGTDELMSLYGPGEMTSTHSANPICSAAALANLQIIERDGLVDNAARLEGTLTEGCRKIAAATGGKVGRWDVNGLVGALQFTLPGTKDPDPETAWSMVQQAVGQGVMLFAPVGVGGGAVKINPPLSITEDALVEGLEVLEGIAAAL